MKIFKKEYLPVILLAAAIALSPSFSAGQITGGRVIEIRVEDILIVILGLVWMTNFLISGRKKIEKPPLLLPILAWLGVGFFSVLTNWILGNIGFSRGFFYFLKEVQFFFLYFYLFYHIRSLDSAKFIIKFWIFLGFINVGWVVYQIIASSEARYYYGPTAIAEPAASFPSGGFFVLLFIFLFNILLYYFLNLKISIFKKAILIVATISPIIGIIGSGSRTGFLSFIFAILLSLFFFFLKKRNLKTFLSGVLISTIILILIFSFLSLVFEDSPRVSKRIGSVLEPASLFSTYLEGRIETTIGFLLGEALRGPSHLPFFGLGKGYLIGEAHNQYLRNFIETGVIGSIIFLILIFAIIKRAWQGFSKGKDQLSIGLSVGLLVATLTMLFISLATEVFTVVKPSEVYWFFAAITMAVFSINKKTVTA